MSWFSSERLNCAEELKQQRIELDLIRVDIKKIKCKHLLTRIERNYISKTDGRVINISEYGYKEVCNNCNEPLRLITDLEYLKSNYHKAKDQLNSYLKGKNEQTNTKD